MRKDEFEPCYDERVTILTDGERIDGTLFHGSVARLSDFLNALFQQEFQFVKVKEPTVYLRPSGEELGKFPFLMVARDRIVLVMAHAEGGAEAPGRAGSSALTHSARLLRREAATSRHHE